MRDTPPGDSGEIAGDSAAAPDEPNWGAMARAADDASTSWLNSSRRAQWSDSLALFQGRHPSGSKYHGSDYRYRSRLFRPKARATVRKTEAATAAAFFANEQVCSVTAENEDDPYQVASAELNQELVQIRFKQSIPWFLTLVAARQNCETYGFCVSRQYWKYEERLVGTRKEPRQDQFGQPLIDDQGQAQHDEFQIFEVAADHPDIVLIAPENFRFDPGADWMRPVETSPYLIEHIPMFVGEVREKMRAGTWKEYPDSDIRASQNVEEEAIRRQREQGRQPSSQAQAGSVPDFALAWVHLNTIRRQGRDWVFFTLGADKLLTDPRPHAEIYGTERRPYRLGITNVEAHRNYPASKLEMLKDLQSQANDTANLRLDALKLTLQPRMKVLAGSQTASNSADLRVFMPGRPILVSRMDEFEWDRAPDISPNAYMEQDRINSDFDELAGTFGQSSVATNRELNETVGGMELLSGAAGTLGEYELRLFAETWVEPVIQDIIDLEQRLEEDETILALAGQRAQLYQKYGIDRVTDWLLSQRVTSKVNVGIGATNPTTRINNFATIAKILGDIFGPAAAMGLKFDEVCSEIFGAFGYADGKRFFDEDFDPRQAMQQMQGQQGGGLVDPHKLEEVQIKASTDLQRTQIQADTQQRIASMRWGGPANSPDPAKLTETQIKAAADMRASAIQAASHERVAAIRLQQEREAQHAETERELIRQRHAVQGHVIRTLPPAMAKLLVAREGHAARAANG